MRLEHVTTSTRRSLQQLVISQSKVEQVSGFEDMRNILTNLMDRDVVRDLTVVGET